jgi:hypothetical protein
VTVVDLAARGVLAGARIEEASRALHVELLEPERPRERDRVVDLMLVVLEEDEIPLGAPAAGRDERSHRVEDPVPARAPAVQMVRVFEPVDAEPTVRHEPRQLAPPRGVAPAAVRVNAEADARVHRSQPREHLERARRHHRVAVVAAQIDGPEALDELDGEDRLGVVEGQLRQRQGRVRGAAGQISRALRARGVAARGDLEVHVLNVRVGVHAERTVAPTRLTDAPLG